MRFTNEKQVPVYLKVAELSLEFVNHMCSLYTLWCRNYGKSKQTMLQQVWAIDKVHESAGLSEPFTTSRMANKCKPKGTQGGRVARGIKNAKIRGMFSKANALHEETQAIQQGQSQESDDWPDVLDAEHRLDRLSPSQSQSTAHKENLDKYTQDRGGIDGEEQRKWHKRVGQKHQIRSLNSQDPKRTQRSRKKAARFISGTSDSPVDDSGSYNEEDLQHALPTEVLVTKIKRRQLRSKANLAVAVADDSEEVSEDELPIAAASCSRCYTNMEPRKDKQFCESCWSKHTDQCRGIKKNQGAAKRAMFIC